MASAWLGRQDSNLGSWIQSPLPYRLATPEWYCVICTRGMRLAAVEGPLAARASQTIPIAVLYRMRSLVARRRGALAAFHPA
jgi:hypothetical protein